MEESERKEESASGILERYRRLEKLVTSKFPEIIEDSNIERGPGDAPRNLRIFFKNNSFMDVRVTQDGDYSYHWQKEDGEFIRFDNAPHHRQLETFPDHKHKNDKLMSSELVEQSNMEDKLSIAIQILKEDHI